MAAGEPAAVVAVPGTGGTAVSVQALSWVLENSEARLADRLVLVSLADHAKSDGTAAWPSIDTIARHARLSRRQVQYSLAALEAAGAIVRAGESRARTVVWNVVLDPNRVQTLHGADSARVQNPADEGAEVAPEPSKNRQVVPPLTPPRGGAPDDRARRGRRGRVRGGGEFDPSEPLSEFELAAYRRMGVDLPAGATHGDAESASTDGGAA
jgi:hypothetical protein